MSGKVSASVNISGTSVRNESEALQFLEQSIRERAPEQPVIVFHLGNTAEIAQPLSLLYHGLGVYFAYISTVAGAIEHRTLSENMSQGVWLVHSAFGRGFDLKFPVDALVCVVDSRGTLDLTEANQMVGRSSRSQGVCHGRVWTVTEQAFGHSVSVEQVLRQREVVNDDDGPMILKALLKIWDAGI